MEENDYLKEDNDYEDDNLKISHNKNNKEEEEGIYKINRKGNMLMYFYNKEGEPLIVIGPQWCFSILLIIIINFISFIYIFFLWNLLFYYIKVIGFIIHIYFYISFGLVCFSNPGIPSKDLFLENYLNSKNIDEPGSYRICSSCKFIMRVKDKTEHCELCDICIIGHDHHCPWTSKCIGKNNLYFFYSFMSSIILLIFFYFFGVLS